MAATPGERIPGIVPAQLPEGQVFKIPGDVIIGYGGTIVADPHDDPVAEILTVKLRNENDVSWQLLTVRKVRSLPSSPMKIVWSCPAPSKEIFCPEQSISNTGWS